MPIAGEPLGDADVYGDDRAVRARCARTATPDEDGARRRRPRARARRRRSVEIDLPEPAALGAEFVRWEIATAVAGALLGINPFDEPNVQQAKDATRVLLDALQGDGRCRCRRRIDTLRTASTLTLSGRGATALTAATPRRS